MSKLVEKEPSSNKNKKKTWSKRIEADDITKEVNVREIDNGYIVRLTKYGKFGKGGEWKEESREVYSKTNPLEVSLEDSLIKDMKKSLFSDSIFE